MTRRR